jgi:hypothetical protein
MIKSIDIEPTNKCNLSCSECWARTSNRVQGFMSWSLFEKLVDEADKLDIRQIGLNFSGEPTLHPKFSEMIDYISSKRRILISFSTNGTHVTDNIIQSICKGAVNWINFSVHNKDHYILIYNAIQKIKALQVKSILEIGISINLGGHSQGELLNEIGYWLSIGDKIRITATIVDMEWKYAPPGYKIIKNNRKHCHINNGLSVLWDGKATICCHDIGQELAFGDLVNNTIEKTWFSKERLNIVKNNHLCDKCKLWQYDGIWDYPKLGSK